MSFELEGVEDNTTVKAEEISGKSSFDISDDKEQAVLKNGKKTVRSLHCATVIRGYNPPSKLNSLKEHTFLPYVNGCSTRQIFPPERLGDPTLQLLYIPPFSSEQAHHIHSTARVVYCLEGEGESVVGLNGHTIRRKLEAGMVIVLEEMSPHHFETKEQGLKVFEGVYTAVSGPNYVSKAELRLIRNWGSDTIGMSTVPEVIVAKHMGMKCFGISVITDFSVYFLQSVITSKIISFMEIMILMIQGYAMFLYSSF